ncbi:nuclear transport factor 2 family protein [Chloroflexota bacterium]
MDYNSLENRIARLEAYNEVQRVMAKYMVIHIDGPHIANSPKLFALNTPGVLVRIAKWGVFRGKEQILKLYKEGHGDTSKPRPGTLVEHDLTTPIIEVAKDCQTAKAVWFSPGFYTVVEAGKKPVARWRWLKIGAAFIVEDGVWKLWKYSIYSTFFADYYKSWVDWQPPDRPKIEELGPEDAPYDNPYKPDGIREPIPAAPEPYDTWDLPIDWIP